MISLEEAKKIGIKIVGTEPNPDFVVGSKSGSEAIKNIVRTNEIQDLLNEKLEIRNYSNNIIKHFTYICLIIPTYNGLGVDWQERKYFKRKEKKFFIDIKFPDYEKFCKTNKKEALKIMAEQTLRGTKKYLSKVKGFDFERFYNDLEQVFINEK